MKLNKYLPFAFIYFFLNSLGLPFGLTWTALLAPLFYFWIWTVRKKDILWPFIVILAPFIIIHLVIVGAESSVYFFSLLNLLLVYIFCQAFYTFLKESRQIEYIFNKILGINFIFCLIAIPFYFSSWFSIFWDQQDLAGGISGLRRLKMFVYEPSYYALIFVPVFFYFLLQYFFGQYRKSGIRLLPMLLLPIALSLSFGVIAAILFALFITWILYFRSLTKKRRILNGLVYTGAGMGAVLVFLVLFFRRNPFFLRIGNIIRGEDTSGNGRTFEAFVIARKLLNDGSEAWGIGLGQIKILGENIIRSYYLYNKDFVATIPNAAAETLAIFGWAGLSLRLLIEIVLFWYTRVWSNYYRLVLFLFIFIYQFSGSFITNVAEYVIWILAFTPGFRQFNVQSRNAAASLRSTQVH